MSLFRFLGVLSPAHMHFARIFSRMKFVGQDSFGNKYYKSKPRKGRKRERRFVFYKGAQEASKIPPLWHGWIHHQTDTVPSDKTKAAQHKWQKPHQPNLTGTPEAYFPSGHSSKEGARTKVSGDYEAWSPQE